MKEERFESLVAEAVATLPEEFLLRMENVEIMVADLPSALQLEEAGLHRGEDLLGLYEGIPLTHRGLGYGMVTPDIITVFRKSILAKCRNHNTIVREIRRVVLHEIAHHFGISDRRLAELEDDWD